MRVYLLLLWQAWLVSFQGIPAGVGGWDSRISGEKVGEEDLYDPLKIGREEWGHSR